MMKLVYERDATASPADSGAGALQRLAMAGTLEATPQQLAKAPPLAEWLSVGTGVYVPSLPDTAFETLHHACQQVMAMGMQPVPHLPARAVRSRGQLRSQLQRLREAGVRRLMLIAGDRDRVQGPFRDTLDLLGSGLLGEYGFDRLGITGYPGGHPTIPEPALRAALQTKCEYAQATRSRLWIVTQFAFEPASYLHWLEWLREQTDSARLPVYVGIAGPTRLRSLIAFAAQCGVGATSRLLSRRPSAARLLRTWTPDGLVQALAQHPEAAPGGIMEGFHLYPFGGLQQSAHWLQQLRSGPDSGRNRSTRIGH